MSLFNNDIYKWIQAMTFVSFGLIIGSIYFFSDSQEIADSKLDIISEEELQYEDNTANIQTKFSVYYLDSTTSILTTTHFICTDGSPTDMKQHNDTIPGLGLTSAGSETRNRKYDFFITVN